MSNDKMSPEMQIAIRRSPDYTAPSAELVALRAEVAAWRRAMRWRLISSSTNGANPVSVWELRVGVRGTITTIGVVKQRPDGWMAMTDAVDPEFGLTDRNTACAKVCELLGIPTVLPGGE